MNENTDKTDSGIPVKQFFTKQDIKKEKETDPGTYPFLEGYILQCIGSVFGQ